METLTKLYYSFILLIFILTNAQGIAQSKYLTEIGVIDSLYSKTLEEKRVFWVQVPENFNSKSQRKYPVIYIMDGGVHLNAVSTIHNYYSGGFIPEMIIVGVSNRNNRTRDLTTSKIKTRREFAYNQDNGEAEKFTQFIEKELIPYIDSKYPTTDYRTLIGHSYGGLYTINTLIHHTDLFANYLAIDPSLDWDNQKLLMQSKEILKNKSFNGKSLFISLGGQLHMQNSEININNVMKDTTEFSLFARSNIEFSRYIEKNKQSGLFFKWMFYPKDLHGTIPLPSIKDGLLSIFEWFQMENTDKINSPETSKEELLSIIKYRAKKLKSHFGYQVPPYPEDLLNMSGYMNLDMQQPEKSKMYFECAIEYYPKSANVYDSMADYYETQKDIINALKFVAKAYELSGDSHHKKRIEELKKITEANK